MFRGEDSIYKFFEALFEEEKEINEYMKKFYKTDMILTKKQKENIMMQQNAMFVKKILQIKREKESS